MRIKEIMFEDRTRVKVCSDMVRKNRRKKKPPRFFVHVNEWQFYAAKDLCTFTEVCVITYRNGRDILSERHHEENKNRGGFAVSYLNKP